MIKQISLLAGTVALSLGLMPVAHASTFHNGWHYSIDAQGDGSGGNVYDIQGLAFKETADRIFFAVSANLPLAGNASGGAADGNIGWGDLMLNFTGDSYAAAEGNLLGIRFADTNDSGVSQLGVYGNVTTSSVTQDNQGYSTLNKYYETGGGKFDVADTMGDLTDKSDAYEYFGGQPDASNVAINNVIAGGTFLGGIDLLSDQATASAGLDFGNFNATGDELIAFSFDRSLIPTGSFIASLFLECGNDGGALHGETADVPEPSAVGGLVLLGMVVGGRQLRKRRTALA
ncbi:MAG: PEP-CTERM sorting domain-containing protein [Cyanobacteria bacterium J06629_9]